MKFNLISVSKLAVDSGLMVKFIDKHCYVQDSARMTVAENGNLVGGLYHLN